MTQAAINKEEAELISGLAHDLRTPLSSILLTAEMLERGAGGEMTEKGRAYLLSIRQSVKAMAEIIDSFLATAKKNNGGK